MFDDGDGDGLYLDHDTAILIAQLQLQDALEVSQSRKGKSPATDALSDEEVAFRIQAEELDSWKQTFQDNDLAKSLSNALEQDADILEAHHILEEAAAADRRAAELISRGSALPAQTDAQRRLEDRTFNVESIPESATATPRSRRAPVPQLGEEEPEDSIWRFDEMSDGLNAAGPSIDRFKRVSCVACNSKLRIKDTILMPCEHYWCSACLMSLVEAYLRGEDLHPLRCCRNRFGDDDISAHLKNQRLFEQFQTKRSEYEVLAQNRVYCATQTCSAFLGSSDARPAGNPNIQCPQCHAQTCSICRKPSHPGDTCTNNEAIEQVRALAREIGWQTCPGCFTIVDLHHGCNHMTCTCRAEFCFVCGVRWKNCQCPQWDEARLEATAEMRAQNDLGRRVREAEPQRFYAEVQRMADNLRVNHDCNPHRWRGTGPGACEECGDYLPVFLKMCRDCNLVVCRRCSLNRLW